MALRIFGILMVWVCMASSAATTAQSAIHLEIFTDEELALPNIPGVNIVAHNMNAIAREQDKISRRFTGNTVEEAQKKAEAWVRSPAYQEYAVHRERIFFPIRRAAQFQIAKIPAVLINEQFIVYGTSDPRTALDDYHRFLLTRSSP